MDGKVRFLRNVLFWGTVSGLLFLIFRYAVPVLLPFLLGFSVAAMLNPLVEKLTALRPRAFVSAFVVFPFWGILLFLLWKLGALLYGEVAELLVRVQQTDFAEAVGGINLPFLSEDTAAWLSARLDSFLPSLVDVVQSVLMGFLDLLIALPNALIFSFVTVVSSYLFSVRYPEAEPFLLRQLPARWQAEYFDVKEFLLRKIFRIFRAYGIMIGLNLALLLVGFWMLKVPYALVLAALIALFDLLPYVGIPSVLIPWGIAEWFLLNNSFRGIGLTVLAVIVFLVRELLEPRIVGKNIGLSALLSLFSIYLGVKVMGFLGAFIFPLLFLLIKEWNDSGRIFLWKTDATNNST